MINIFDGQDLHDNTRISKILLLIACCIGIQTTFAKFLLNTIQFKLTINRMTVRNQSLSEEELLHMANLTAKETGIKDVIVWVGCGSDRIKVSNVPNALDGKDCFTITIPDYKVIGTVNAQFITPDTIKDIISYLVLNNVVIKQYADYEISTANLINSVRKLSERG